MYFYFLSTLVFFIYFFVVTYSKLSEPRALWVCKPTSGRGLAVWNLPWTSSGPCYRAKLQPNVLSRLPDYLCLGWPTTQLAPIVEVLRVSVFILFYFYLFLFIYTFYRANGGLPCTENYYEQGEHVACLLPCLSIPIWAREFSRSHSKMPHE